MTAPAPLYLVAAMAVFTATVEASIERDNHDALLASCQVLKTSLTDERAKSCQYYIYGFLTLGKPRMQWLQSNSVKTIMGVLHSPRGLIAIALEASMSARMRHSSSLFVFRNSNHTNRLLSIWPKIFRLQ